MNINKYILNALYVKKNNVKVYLHNTFDKIDCEVDNVKIKIDRISIDKLEITLSSKAISCDELKNTFLLLYEFMGVVIGYFPSIISGTNLDIDKLVKMYETSDKYIIAQTSFIRELDNTKFIKVYNNFKDVYEKMKFQINYYFYAVCSINDSYPEFPIVNILQSIDGIYDLLKITKGKRFICDDKEKIKQVKNKINNIDLSDMCNENEKKIFSTAINDCISRIENVNYGKKLDVIFRFVNDNFNIFELEEDNNIYQQFVIKCKHTRNKFSHSVNLNNSFNGNECVFYLYKLSLVFRILIINEIELSEYIDKDLLNYVITITDERLKEVLSLEV